jgi:hypothetical protein
VEAALLIKLNRRPSITNTALPITSAPDLARRHGFAEHEVTEQDCGDGDQQRHQHDIGRAGTPWSLDLMRRSQL